MPTIVCNWKMNSKLPEYIEMVAKLKSKYVSNGTACDLVICPPFTLLGDVAREIKNSPIKLGAQNCHQSDSGAFTGEVSASMLSDALCAYVILGHSERRNHNAETSELVSAKAATAHACGLISIVCVGETLYEKDNGLTEVVVREQVVKSLPESYDGKNTIIAYEPVWAIGGNKTPSLDEISATHSYIKEVVDFEYPQFAKQSQVLYGGSVSAQNAADILGASNVDGLLVGRASLQEESIWQIVESASAK